WSGCEDASLRVYKTEKTVSAQESGLLLCPSVTHLEEIPGQRQPPWSEHSSSGPEILSCFPRVFLCELVFLFSRSTFIKE
ncbi:mCG1043099, partial [Mus musculus]